MIHPRVLTTSRESASKKGRGEWLGFLPTRNCLDRSSLYVFTDGSTKGSFAAVYVRGADPAVAVEERVEFKEPTGTKNMGAEWNGLLLALGHAPKGSKLVVVSDLLWLGATVVGARKAEHPELVESLRQAKETIEQRGLEVRFVHHEGHQKDESDFTRWNVRADELCKARGREAAKK